MRGHFASWFLSWSLLSVELYAQPKPPPKGPEVTVIAAQRSEQAMTYFNLLEYQSALEAFKEAYSLSRDPAVLFYIGQCYEQLGKPEQALVSYQTYLEVGSDAPLRMAVSSLIEQQKQRVALTNSTVAKRPTSLITADQEHKGSSNPALLLYGGALSAGVFGGVAGAVALSSRLRVARLAIEENSPRDFLVQSRRAQSVGLTSDLLLFGGLASGVAAYLVKPSPHLTKGLFGGAAFLGGLGVAAGVVALSADQKSQEGDDKEARFQGERAKVYSRSADLLFLSAVVSGGLGLWCSAKKEKQITVLPSLRGATLSVGF
jgi:hypothetical protein